MPGLLVAVLIAAVARALASLLPSLPDVVAALVIGVIVGNLGASRVTLVGTRFAVRYGLKVAIIALGAGLDLRVVAARGWATLAVIVALVAIAMTLGLVLGRIARLDRTVAVLLGVGTAICGASAILAVSPLIRARERETAYAVTTISAFNLVALLCLPWIGHELHFSQVHFGTWIGTSVNDTSVVVATGFVYGSTAGGVATVVKLTRTALLVPLCMIVGFLFGPAGSRDSLMRRTRQSIPWFVLGFFVLALVNTLQVVHGGLMPGIARIGSLILVVVLAAVGLNVDLDGLRSLGAKPLLIGFALAITMVLISGLLIWLVGIG